MSLSGGDAFVTGAVPLGFPVDFYGTATNTTCDASTGLVHLGFLEVDGTVYVDGNLTPAPNTVIPLMVGSVTLNEQTPLDDGLEVTAVHVSLPGPPSTPARSAKARAH